MHNEETLAIGTAMPVDHEGPEVQIRQSEEGTNMSIIADPRPDVTSRPEPAHVAGIREVLAELSETCRVSLTQFVSDTDLYATIEIESPLKFLSIDLRFTDDYRSYEVEGVDNISILQLVEHIAIVDLFSRLVHLLQMEATSEGAVRLLSRFVPPREPYLSGLALRSLRESAGVSFDALRDRFGFSDRALKAVEAGVALFGKEECAEYAGHVVAIVHENALSTGGGAGVTAAPRSLQERIDSDGVNAALGLVPFSGSVGTTKEAS